jgi:hypothetical protein
MVTAPVLFYGVVSSETEQALELFLSTADPPPRSWLRQASRRKVTP